MFVPQLCHCTAAVAVAVLGSALPSCRHHGCLENARSFPQDPDRSVAVDRGGRLVLGGDGGDDAFAVPSGAIFVRLGADRQLRRGGQCLGD